MIKYLTSILAAPLSVFVWLSAPMAIAESPVEKSETSAKIEKLKAHQKTTHSKKAKLNENKEEKALAILMQRKDVIAWLKAFDGPDNKSPKTGGHAIWRFDGHSGDVYTIQGVEVMDDHEVTFGWYHVNVTTRAITKEE